MSTDTQEKVESVARMLQGKVVENTAGLEICAKGTTLGFPATLQAIGATFPFGVTYIVETNVLGEKEQEADPDVLNLTIMPRYAKGILGFITRLLLLESKGQRIGERKFDSKYILSFNEHSAAERFLKYPGVMEKIDSLQTATKFSELGIKAKAGLYLSQPTNFNSISLDVVRTTFKAIGELGQILVESF
ncbi:MAG: hypothetical protein K2X93_28395 [Candidatus Obscuribacterales bacterium]|nr:hypothetical protein [Candidatus Obscuribacterales bacterium]